MNGTTSADKPFRVVPESFQERQGSRSRSVGTGPWNVSTWNFITTGLERLAGTTETADPNAIAVAVPINRRGAW